MLLKIVYLLTCRSFSLAVLAFRGDLAKDAEVLVLRHGNAVLRRRAGRAASATLTPVVASSRAQGRPIPQDAPVMTARGP